MPSVELKRTKIILNMKEELNALFSIGIYRHRKAPRTPFIFIAAIPHHHLADNVSPVRNHRYELVDFFFETSRVVHVPDFRV